MAKRRNKVIKEVYFVDSKAVNQFIFKSKDESIDKVPDYRLIKTTSNNIAQTLKGGKRGIVEKIILYEAQKSKYKFLY